MNVFLFLLFHIQYKICELCQCFRRKHLFDTKDAEPLNFCVTGRGKSSSKAQLMSWDLAIAQHLLANVKKWTSSHVTDEKRNKSMACAKLP